MGRRRREIAAAKLKHEPGLAAGLVREGEGWSVCGAPRALGESIVFYWGDALGLAYVG